MSVLREQLQTMKVLASEIYMKRNDLEQTMEILYEMLSDKNVIDSVVSEIKSLLPDGYRIGDGFVISPFQEKDKRVPSGYTLQLYLLKDNKPTYVTEANANELKPVTEKLAEIAPEYALKKISFSITPASQ